MHHIRVPGHTTRDFFLCIPPADKAQSSMKMPVFGGLGEILRLFGPWYRPFTIIFHVYAVFVHLYANALSLPEFIS